MISAKNLIKLLLRPEYRRRETALQKLKNTPRYTPTRTNLLGTEIELVDAASFVFMYREIFEHQIYRFKSENSQPMIIDCGANIGLSVLYFKQIYPNSKVIAFEPDAKCYKVLKHNIVQFGLADVEPIDKAVWSSETVLEFMSEGADAGRVIQLEAAPKKYQVKTVRLRDYLIQPVDFLKIDIEGAETEVIQDCRDLLKQVKNVFIEYHSFVNQPQTLHIIVNILYEAGFRIHIQPSTLYPQPFYQKTNYAGMDLQLNIFAYRV